MIESYTYEHPRPSVTVDCVVFGFDGKELKVLLIERGIEPYKGQWAIPGGFVQMDESLHEAAKRELESETGVKNVYMEQLYTFGEVERDPRGRVISVAYYALVRSSDYELLAGDDASNANWFTLNEMPALPFDHNKILVSAMERLRGKIRYQPIGFELLDEKFTMPELQHLYECILNTKLDRRNFSTKMLKTGLLIELDEKKTGTPHRAPRLLKFDKVKYEELSKKGFNFEI